jgi:DNA-binding MarR family transcriptional regulator
MTKFEAVLRLRAQEVSSLDEKDRHLLIKQANLTKQIKRLEERIEWCKWVLQ